MNRIYTADEFAKIYKPGMEFEFNSTMNPDSLGWCKAWGNFGFYISNPGLKYRIIGKDDNMQTLKEYTLAEFKKVWQPEDNAEFQHGTTWLLVHFKGAPNSFPFVEGPWRFTNIETQNLRDPGSKTEVKDNTMKTKKKSDKHSNVGNKTGKIPVGTIVWKKVYDANYNNLPDKMNTGVYIAKLIVLTEGVVPIDARYPSSAAYVRKVRAPKVAVVQVYQLTKDKLLSRPDGVKVVSAHDWKTEWNQGTIVESPYWNDDEYETCTSGIHFYRTLAEAKRH